MTSFRIVVTPPAPSPDAGKSFQVVCDDSPSSLRNRLALPVTKDDAQAQPPTKTMEVVYKGGTGSGNLRDELLKYPRSGPSGIPTQPEDDPQRDREALLAAIGRDRDRRRQRRQRKGDEQIPAVEPIDLDAVLDSGGEEGCDERPVR